MRILIIEDEEPLARALKAGLESEGFSCEIKLDGQEGYWAAREGNYDALVLDLKLPSMNGYQICAELRGSGIWTPILMLTAKDGELDEAEALDTGADDFLSKPFSYVVLVARLRAILRRSNVDRSSVLEVGDLKLSPSEHRVWRGTEEVTLTPRQFSLLEFLMRHPGEVVGKDEILHGVWDVGFGGDPNIVEVYVGHLRRKVDVPFGRNAIETVRLLGYRLAASGG